MPNKMHNKLQLRGGGCGASKQATRRPEEVSFPGVIESRRHSNDKGAPQAPDDGSGKYVSKRSVYDALDYRMKAGLAPVRLLRGSYDHGDSVTSVG